MRKKDSHKGDNGVVLVIGGSEKYSGAPYLAAKAVAALRLGPDLVFLAAPQMVAWAANSLSPDLITVKLKGDIIHKGHLKKLVNMTKKADVVLLGPGLGKDPKTVELVRKLLPHIHKPLVLDADAIKMVKLQDLHNTVITPHKREFEILLENSGLTGGNFRQHMGNNVVVLKGKRDKIVSQRKVKWNKTGNEAMTVGGTGDVLAGLVAGYISQGKDLFTSASKAANINGKIGNKLKHELKYGLIASDFLKEIAKLAK